MYRYENPMLITLQKVYKERVVKNAAGFRRSSSSFCFFPISKWRRRRVVYYIITQSHAKYNTNSSSLPSSEEFYANWPNYVKLTTCFRLRSWVPERLQSIYCTTHSTALLSTVKDNVKLVPMTSSLRKCSHKSAR